VTSFALGSHEYSWDPTEGNMVARKEAVYVWTPTLDEGARAFDQWGISSGAHATALTPALFRDRAYIGHSTSRHLETRLLRVLWSGSSGDALGVETLAERVKVDPRVVQIVLNQCAYVQRLSDDNSRSVKYRFATPGATSLPQAPQAAPVTSEGQRQGRIDFWKTVWDGARRIFALNPPRRVGGMTEAEYDYIRSQMKRIDDEAAGAARRRASKE